VDYYKHPEVSLYIGLLTSLYAGTALLISFKYSINNYIVKKLEQKSQSAGNIISGTPETLREGIVNIPRSRAAEGAPEGLENIKLISKHVPKHIKPLNDEQLGYYLAGLIDGNGHFSKIPQLVIVFSSPDAFLAYLIKERLGYGSVKKVKGKNAYILVVANKEGILRVLNLINGKLRSKHRFDQVINNILSNNKYKEFISDFTMNNSNEFDNHWFAGFSDADGSFQVKIIHRSTRKIPEIRLNFQIDQKNDSLLKFIKDHIGGNIGYRKSQDTYYYGSTSFGSARKIIRYFDKFHLQSRKYISYLK